MEQEHKVRGTGRFYRLAITFALAGLVIGAGCENTTQEPITQEPIARLGKGTLRQVQFTPDGKYVALRTSLGVELRDPATLEQRAFFEAPGFGTMVSGGFDTIVSDGSGEMHITNDGKRIAVAGSGAIALWDVETKQRTAVLGGEKSPWLSFQFSPDGMLCAASTPAGVEIRSGDGKRRIATIKGSASALRFSPDGELLAGMTWRASPDGNKESAFRVWKIASYAPPVWMPRILTAVMVVVTLLIAFLSLLVFKKRIRSKRWRLAVVLLGGVAGFLIASFWVNPLIFRIPSCREIATIPLEKSVTQAFFSPDGSLLFLGGGVQGAGHRVVWGGFQGGGDTVIWDVSTNQEVARLGDSRAIALSPDGTLLAILSDPQGSVDVFHTKGQIKLWDVEKRQQLTAIDDVFGARGIRFSPDGRLLAWVGYNNNTWDNDVLIKLWDVAAQSEVAGLRVSKLFFDNNNSFDFSPDGKGLVSAVERTVKLWAWTTTPKVVTLKGHTAAVTAVDFSPAGKLLASGAADGSLKLWQMESEGPTGVSVGTLSAHQSGVELVKFSPDGSLLASVAKDQIKLWDPKTEREIDTLPQPADVKAIDFSPDSGYLAVGLADKTIALWKMAPSRLLTTFSTHRGPVTSISFSSDGRLLASGSEGHKTISLWEKPAGGWDAEPQPKLTEFDTRRDLYSLAFLPDGMSLASSGWGEISIWDVDKKHKDAFWKSGTGNDSLRFSPDGRFLSSNCIHVTSAGDFFGIKLFDVASQRLISVFIEHNKRIRPAFSPDSRWMASAQNEFVKVWTVGDLVPKVTVREHVRIVHTVRFSSDGKLLLAGDYYESHLWDVATRQEVTTVERQGVRESDNVDISPNGEMLAMRAQGPLGERYPLELWDVSTKRKVRTLALNDPFAKVRFSHTGRFLASWGEREKSVRVWDLNVQPDVVKNVKASEQTSFSFSPDGVLLAIGTRGGIELWDVKTQKQVGILGSEADEDIRAFDFSPDGVLLAIGTKGGIELWDVKTQQAVATLKIKTDEVVKAFAFSPDGVLLAIATTGGIELWDVKTRHRVETVESDAAYINEVEFSPDGGMLAVGGRNLRSGSARLDLWDVASKSKQKIATHLPRDSRNCFCFSPDGKRLAFLERSWLPPTGTFAVYIWDIATERRGGAYMDHTSYRGIKFSPDGALLALTGGEGSILFDVKTQRVVAVLPSSDGSSRSSVAFSADGELLAIANRDGLKRQVHVWNVEAAKRSVMLFPFERDTHLDKDRFVCFSPDDARIAAGTGKTVKVWNVETKEEVKSIEAPTDTRYKEADVRFDKSTATFPGKRRSKSNGLTTKKEVKSIEARVPIAFADDIKYVGFSRDGSLQIVASSESTISLWDAAADKFVTLFHSSKWDSRFNVKLACLSPDGSLLAMWRRGTFQL